MVTQQDFIRGLLEPLEPAMAPLAMADAPGAVVRGLMSGGSLPGVLGSLDPLSMEGRVHGEDITGSPTSGLLVEMLTDPLTLAGGGLGGLGMAMSRRGFLKRAGRGATGLAGAATGGEGLLRHLLEDSPKVEELLRKWSASNRSFSGINKALKETYADTLVALAPHGKGMPGQEAVTPAELIERIRKDSRPWGPLDDAGNREYPGGEHIEGLTRMKDRGALLQEASAREVAEIERELRAMGVEPPGINAVDKWKLALGIKEPGFSKDTWKQAMNRLWKEITGVPWAATRVGRHAPKPKAKAEAEKTIGGIKEKIAARDRHIVPADMEILARLIREMSLNRAIPGGSPRGY